MDFGEFFFNMKKSLYFLLFIVCSTGVAETTCRSASVKHQFDKLNGYPNGRPGYVVDHICSLFNGGLDSVTNMQYQTIEEGHKKDRVENTPEGKKLYCNPSNSTPTRQVFNCKTSKGSL